jgi:hypothetical protein
MVDAIQKEYSSAAPRATTDVVRREVAGEVFLVPIRGSLADLEEMFILNEVGAWLWDRLDGIRTFEALVADVTQEFDTSFDEVRDDLQEFIDELLRAGLAEYTSTTS